MNQNPDTIYSFYILHREMALAESQHIKSEGFHKMKTQLCITAKNSIQLAIQNREIVQTCKYFFLSAFVIRWKFTVTYIQSLITCFHLPTACESCGFWVHKFAYGLIWAFLTVMDDSCGRYHAKMIFLAGVVIIQITKSSIPLKKHYSKYRLFKKNVQRINRRRY